MGGYQQVTGSVTGRRRHRCTTINRGVVELRLATGVVGGPGCPKAGQVIGKRTRVRHRSLAYSDQ
jgi:hypothetical protein